MLRWWAVEIVQAVTWMLIGAIVLMIIHDLVRA